MAMSPSGTGGIVQPTGSGQGPNRIFTNRVRSRVSVGLGPALALRPQDFTPRLIQPGPTEESLAHRPRGHQARPVARSASHIDDALINRNSELSIGMRTSRSGSSPIIVAFTMMRASSWTEYTSSQSTAEAGSRAHNDRRRDHPSSGLRSLSIFKGRNPTASAATQ